MHPPLPTGQLNTSTQVNNTSMLHLIYNGHTYVHHINITVLFVLYTSSALLDRLLAPIPLVGIKYSVQYKGYNLIRVTTVEAGATRGTTQEAKYIEGWLNTTSAWTGWSRFDILVDRYGGVHSLLICTSSQLGFPTCHRASPQDNAY